MNLKNIDELLKNTYLKEKINNIDKIIDKNKNENAYYKLAAMLEYINIKFISSKLKLEIKDSDIINIINLYKAKDEKLYKKMMNINSQYEMVSEYKIDIDDVISLAISINSIYKYIVDNYGEFI